jgi:hypothetical protein
MQSSKVFSILGLVMLISLFWTSAHAQNSNTGAIRGTVTDLSGAVIPGATVTILDVQTGVKTSRTTNSVGIYDAPSLPAGEYSITFSANGFRDLVHNGIVLTVETIGIDATLQVGNASENVVVTSETPILETVTAEQQTTLTTQTVTDAPIVGGAWYSMTTLMPGTGGSGYSSGSSNASTGQSVAINGSREYDIDFFIDGLPATSPRDNNASNFYPPIDSIAGITADTTGYGAQYGNGVAVINLGIKGGTDQFHGSAYEFVQNSVLDSRNYFSTTGSKPPVHWNEFGGSVGGPIIKNKLFFFFNYQRNPNHSAYISNTTVPTAAMRAGNFSNSEFTATIYNAGAPINGGTNILLPVQESQIALKIQNLIPQPQNDALFNNFQEKITGDGTQQWWVYKQDWQIKDNHRLSGTFFMLPTSSSNTPGSLDPGCVLNDCSSGGSRNTAGQLSEVWTINQAMVNVVHVGASRESDTSNPGTYNVGDVTKIGLEPAYGPNAPGDMFPNINVNAGAGVAGIGLTGGYHAYLDEGTYTVSDILSVNRGKHTLSTGGEWDRYYQEQAPWGDTVSGAFTFSGVGNSSGTSIDPRTGTTTGGIPYADFLMGNVEQWNALLAAGTSTYLREAAGFVQDQYQLTRDLTVNIGLRYTYTAGWSVKHNKFSEFNPNLVNPATNTQGALWLGGQNGYNELEHGVSEWAPRIGVAWSPFKSWVFHGSYGIYPIPRDAEDFTDGTMGQGLNDQGSLGGANTVIFPLDGGPPAGSVVYPTVANSTPALLNGQVVDTYWPNSLHVQYMQDIDVDAQHQMPGNWMMQASYVYTRGEHLGFARDINQVKVLGSGIRPYPQYQSIVDYLDDGFSNYNALQLRAEKRFSGGFAFLVNYAWSKMMDTGSGSGHGPGEDNYQDTYTAPFSNYSNSITGAPQNLNGSITYALPFGSAQRFKLRGVANEVLGGWRLDTIFTEHSGVPFTPNVATDTSGSLSGPGGSGYGLLPNRIGSGKLSNPTLKQWFDPTAFTLPAPDTFGDSRRNILSGPHYEDVDLSVGKSFRIREGLNLQIRADGTDAFNHPNFGAPNATISGSNSTSGVGALTSTLNGGSPDRTIQMGSRLTF